MLVFDEKVYAENILEAKSYNTIKTQGRERCILARYLTDLGKTPQEIKKVFSKIPMSGGEYLSDKEKDIIYSKILAKSNEYDFVTGAALTDLDYRLTTLDASLGDINAQNHVKFVSLDSSLYGLQNGLDGLRNDLQTHINDTSNISGSVKPEDIEQYINPVRLDIYNTSVNLNGRINDTVSRVIDCEHDISTLYYTTNITNRGMINDVSNRLFVTNESLNEYNATLANHSAQISELYNNSQAVAQVTETIDNINASIGLIKYNDTQRDASITALREYQENTVDSLLSSYSQRLNNAESLAVDSQYIATDVSNRLTSTLATAIADVSNQLAITNSSITNLTSNTLAIVSNQLYVTNTSVNTAIARMNTSVNTVLNDIDQRDFVTATALNLHDTSTNYILGILRTNGLIN